MIRRAMRHVRQRWREGRNRHRPLVLMYHRVADLPYDPWQLAVPPRMFAEQIEALAKSRKIVPLDELLEAETDRPLAAVTFDDGYEDNVTNALPILEHYRCPATLFLVTDAVNEAEAFWWDRLSELILAARLVAPVDVHIAEIEEQVRLAPAITPAERGRLHLRLWEKLRPLAAERRDTVIGQLAASLGANAIPGRAHRTVNKAQVRNLAGSMFAIGAHTLSHPMLSTLGKKAQEREILGSRDACERLTGVRPACFSYPYGDYDDDSLDIVRRSGFKLAVTVNDGHVPATASPWEVSRRAVMACPIDTFIRAVA